MANLIFDYSLQPEVFKKGYTFSDLAMPITADRSTGKINMITDFTTVDNAIRNIFNWMPGQRILLPEFGNLLYKYLYEPVNSVTSQNLANAIRDMLGRWEPRITITDIIVVPTADKNQYDVTVRYTIPAIRGTRNINIELIPLA